MATQEAQRIVVGLGASAGGLQALQEVLAGIPEETDAAFVVVQHLSPDFETRMDELLAGYTRLPVKRAENEMELESGVVYLMPPKVEMILANGRLLLSERPSDHGLWLPIDGFFRSIGEESGPRAVGVILSGTGSDGSRGVRAIHEGGGAVIAQEPATARFDGMPRAAIDTGVVDVVLPPRKIGEAIARYVEHAKGGERPFTTHVEREGLEGVFELLERDTGVDFSVYKASTIGRRLERRLVMTGAADVQGYLDKIRDDHHERETLYRDLLIGVTSFFRDPEAFTNLDREYLPDLIRALPEGEPLRVWAAGCATGEEAYSIAIAAFEAFRRLDRRPRVRLFATDVHRGSLEIASSGIYDDASLANIDRDLRARYFIPTEGRFRVIEELRSSIVFAYHNVLRDAPFTKLDLVSCRNLLIYFSAEAQRKVLGLFHFALKTNGVLFLGPSETPGGLAEELGPVDRRWKIYRKRREARLAPDLRSLGTYQVLRTHKPVRAEDVLDRAKNTLLARFAPPNLIVSADYQLLHSGAGASRFLGHRDGAPSLQVLDMVSGELKYALAAGLKRAREEGAGLVRFDRIPTETPEGPLRVSLTVERTGPDPEPFLVTIEPDEVAETPIEVANETIPDLARERIELLEQELRHTKETLQATVEEMEASNEELQATNEELIASNEELHSANEELQSVNEELYTVNAEHQQKIVELQQLTDDMEHLFQATDVHTVFLDSQLKIRKFTPKMGETFNLLEQDIGRAIDCFTHRLKDDRLIDDARAVLGGAERVEREVLDLDGNWYLLRILPYRPREAIDGIVLTLVDVSSIRRAELELAERETELSAILENSATPIYARRADGSLLMAGRAARKLFGEGPPGPLTDAERRALETGETAEELRRVTVDGEERTFSAIAFRVKRGAPIVAVVMTDITDRERAVAQERDAVAQRDRFLAMLSHELRNPVAAIASAAEVLASQSGPEGQRAATALTRQTRHIKDLLDDLLDVNRIAMERLSLRRQAVDLSDVIEQSLETTARLASERGVRVVPPEPIELSLVADRARLSQMITNLLVNAVKFSERGGEVKLETSIEDRNLRIRVTDRGVGIAPEERERIFGLFYQLEEDRARSGGGLGVGLSLAKTIAELHGGTIEVESEGRGKGASFCATIPIERARARKSSGVAAIAPVEDPLDIVVVEDQSDNRELMAMLVEALGHRPIGVATASEAVSTILRVRPSLALIDIGLPETDGYTVARRIRAEDEGRSLCLVALTGYGRPDDKARSREAGFDDHVVKPISRDELLRLCALAAQRRNRREPSKAEINSSNQ